MEQPLHLNRESLFWILYTAILAYFRILSTSIPRLGLLLYLFEYALIFYVLLFKKDAVRSFAFLLVSLSVSMEMDAFIYLGGEAPFNRYPIFLYRTIYRFTVFMICFFVHMSHKDVVLSTESKKFLKWLTVLGATGAISIIIALSLNDNNMMESSAYPFQAFDSFIDYLVLYSLGYMSFLIANRKRECQFLITIIKCILISMAIVTLLSVGSGFVGFYGDEFIMLTPLIAGFVPAILLMKTNSLLLKAFLVVLVIAIIGISFVMPTASGSKWYLVVLGVMFVYFCSSFNIKNKWVIITLLLGVILLIPLILEALSNTYIENPLVQFKLKQMLKMIDFSSFDSFEDWVKNLDSSAASRIDEPMNVLIEYQNKPWYMFFGKGFAGSTLHYTNIDDWDTLTGFTEYQRKGHFYVELHETTAIILLRHGLCGILFMFFVIKTLLKRMFASSLTIFALFWFVFYWSYSQSMRIGMVATAIVIASSSGKSDVLRRLRLKKEQLLLQKNIENK